MKTFYKKCSAFAMFFALAMPLFMMASCDDLFHEDPPRIHVNKGEVGDMDTYLTHFVNEQCNFYGMKKTIYVKKGDREPIICFVYNKDKYGGVVKYHFTDGDISLRTFVDETKDRNKHWGALLLLLGGWVKESGSKDHIVTITCYDKDNKVIVERSYVYTVVATENWNFFQKHLSNIK